MEVRMPSALAQRPRKWTALVAGTSSLALLMGVLAFAPAPAESAVRLDGARALAAEVDSLAAEPSGLAGGISPAAFKDPASRFKPATRWWWQGPLNGAEAVREINAIADAGFG